MTKRKEIDNSSDYNFSKKSSPINSIFIGVISAFASLFYLKGITSLLYLQPVIFFFILSLNLTLFFMIKKPTISINSKYILLFFIFSFFQIVLQSLFLVHQNGILNELGRIAFPFLIAFTVHYNILKIGTLQILRIFIASLIIILLIDTIYRLYRLGIYMPTLSNRYELKEAGLLFIDPNFNGVIAGAIYLQISKFRNTFKNIIFFRILLLVIIIYSFSYAVYLALLVSLLYTYFQKNKYIWYLSVITFFPLILFSIYYYIQDDGSFITKILIINEVANFFTTESIVKILIGIGHGNFDIYFASEGHGAHNLIGMFAEGGLLFAIIILFLYSYFYKNKENRPTIIFILFSGLISLYPIAYLSSIIVLLGLSPQKQYIFIENKYKKGFKKDES